MHPLMNEHLQSLRQAGYSDNTLELTARWLDHLDASRGQKNLADLSADDLTNWRQQLTWNPGRHGRLYSENTVNQAIGVVRRFFSWALEQGHLSKDPATHLKTRRPPSTTEKLSHDDKKRMLAVPNLDTLTGIRDRALVALMLETRLSRAACSRINLSHLQLDTGALLATGRRGGIYTLSEGLLTDLVFYLEHGRPGLVVDSQRALFLTQNGRRLQPANIGQIFRRCREEAKRHNH